MPRATEHTARRVLKDVETGCAARDAEPFARGLTGDEPVQFAVCRGPGRCLSPSLTVEPGVKVCPFCEWYPDDRGATRPERQEAWVAQHLNGN